MDLSEATTQEIFEELTKRNHTVFLACVKILDHSRIEVFRNSSGAFVLLFGLLKEEMIEAEHLHLKRSIDQSSDDSM